MTPDLHTQLTRMLDLGYPALAGQREADFTRDVRAAIRRVSEVALSPGDTVLLVPQRVPVEAALALTTLPGRRNPAILDRNHGEAGLSGYQPIADIALPDEPVYAVLGLQRGDEFRSVPPKDAVTEVLSRGRTPLTLAEGVAWMTQDPHILQPNHCFMLAGSRRGDKRVPALWISQHAPKLGWCWEGNPHTWLGTASAADRR